MGEAAVESLTHRALQNDSQVVYGVEATWQIKGTLQADTQAELMARIAALRAAYGTAGKDVGLYLEDGTPTGLTMPGSHPLGGVVPVGGVDFQLQGAALSTYVPYSITLVGRYTLGTSGQPTDPGNVPGFEGSVVRFRETLVFAGGGSTFTFLPSLVGPPIRQPTAQATPFQLIQSGSCTSLLGEPAPPAPLWPAHEHRERRRITVVSPQRSGQAQGLYREWTKEWSYEFESATPLLAQPNYWLLGG